MVTRKYFLKESSHDLEEQNRLLKEILAKQATPLYRLVPKVKLI